MKRILNNKEVSGLIFGEEVKRLLFGVNRDVLSVVVFKTFARRYARHLMLLK